MKLVSSAGKRLVMGICAAAFFMGNAATYGLCVYAEEADNTDSVDSIDEALEDTEGEGEEALDSEDKETEQDPVKVMQVRSDDEYVRAYIRGMSGIDASQYQIGNIPVENSSVYPIADDDNSIRTLIMVDNSISIPESSRAAIAEAIKSIVSNSGGNQTFRFSTFSEGVTYLSDKYTDDVTALVNMADAIKYEDQETYLTDVLYDVVKAIDEEEGGYTRIIVFSDGVDNKPIGVTREELNKELEKQSLPIYTVGVKTGSNEDNLEGMFALSRITGADYCLLDEAEADAIAQMMDKDLEISVFEARIPDDAKNGSLQNTKLTLSDGSMVSFTAQMPFSLKETEVEDDTPEDKEIPEEEETETVLTTREKIVNFIFANKLVVALIITAILALVILLIIFKVIKKKKSDDKDEDISPTTPLNEYGKTEILGSLDDNGKTTILTPGDKPGQGIRKIKLTTASDNSRTFRCEIEKEIKIGRMPDNDIVISDDTSVHGHHCTIECKDNAYFMTDLMNVKNHSSVNGVRIKPGFPQLIVTNSKITIGRFTYIVSISEE